MSDPKLEEELAAHASELGLEPERLEDRDTEVARECALTAARAVFLKLKNREPLDGDVAILNHALKAVGKAGSASTWESVAGVPILDAKALLILKDTPISYVLEPIAIRGCLSHIHGPPKGGKSTFSLYLAVCAAWGHFPGEDSLVTTQEPRKVLYLTWEDSAALLARRICNYSAGLGMGFTIPENLHVADAPDIALNLEQCCEALESKIQEAKYDLIVLDTFSHAHDCNEDKAVEIKPVMRALKRIARETQSSFLYVHHRRKDTEGVSMSERARGSTAISAAADVIIDWGDRKGGNVTPMEWDSKWGRSGQWEVEYLPQENGSIKWELRRRGKAKKKTEKNIEMALKAFDTLLPSHADGKISGSTLCELMGEWGINLRSAQRYLQATAETGLLNATFLGIGKGTLYEKTRT